jgi:hypothetical protein
VGLFDSAELPAAIEHFARAARWWIDQVKQVQGASGIDISAASVMLRA